MAERAKNPSLPSALSTGTYARFVSGRFFIAITLLAAWLVAAVALSRGALAGATYDGNWHVTIITQSGNCDKAYSYPVKVSDGRISYSGENSFDISGKVADAGAVSVNIARGDQKASATGKLSASNGSGEWTGKSSSMNCSGRWEATRAS